MGCWEKSWDEGNFDTYGKACYFRDTFFKQHPPRLCRFRPDTRTPAGYFYL